MAITSNVTSEFDELTRKISKLESLRHQLEILDTTGFEAEARLISSKLHDVDSLPQVERDLNALRRKIKIRNLQRVSDEKRSTVNHKQQIKALKRHHQNIERNIRNLKQLIEKKRKISIKKQLTKEQLKFVKDVPTLERQFSLLRRDFKKHISPRNVKVDTGVGMVVNYQFDDFIAAIKAELTHRLRKKELLMDAKLKADLAAHKKIFVSRYKELVKKFHQRYKESAAKKLKKEVQLKFEEALKRSLDKEKQTLVDALLKKGAQKLANERKLMAMRLRNYYEKEYQHRKEQLLARLEHDVETIRRKSAQQRSTLDKECSSLKERKAAVAQENKALMEKLARLRQKSEREVHVIRKDEQDAIDAARGQAEIYLQHYKQKLDAKFARKKVRLQQLSGSLKEREKKMTMHNELIQVAVGQEKAAVERKMRLRAVFFRRKKEWLQAQKKRLRKSLAQERVALQEKVRRMEGKEDAHVHVLEQKISSKLDQERARIRHHGWDIFASLSKEKAQLIRHKQMLSARYVRKSNDLKHRIAILKKQEQLLVSRNTKIRVTLNKEHAALQRKLSKVRGDEQNLLRLIQQQVERKVAEHRQELSDHFEREKALLRKEYDAELRSKLALIRKSHEKSISLELKRRERQLRKMLERSYEQKLALQLKQKSQELDRKRQELETQIVANAKKLFV
ncbi:hypothetical protein HY497_01510 [Candidatus Woesearchaeota archaeon]|nr:hypothetical protein [Candidatus Woesearchaeota archaeon]